MARADVQPEDIQVRGALGLGLGNVGFAGRAAAEGEFWLDRRFGLGLQAVGPAQATVFAGSTSGVLVGPTLALREPTVRGQWLFSGSFGFARMSRTYSNFCPLGCQPPQPAVTQSADGIYYSLGVGHMQVERHGIIGVGLKLDVFGRPDGGLPEPQGVATLNFPFGFSS